MFLLTEKGERLNSTNFFYVSTNSMLSLGTGGWVQREDNQEPFAILQMTREEFAY